MSAASSPPRRPRSGNRRDEAARQAVLHAADDLLVERGFGGLSVEAIARRAGVAKQTIYRWWPSKVEILLDTLIEDSDKRLPVPVQHPSAQDVRDYLHGFAEFLTGDTAGAVLLALLAQAQHDPGTAATFRARYLRPRRALEHAMLTHAADTGEIAPRLDTDTTLDALFGPLIYRALTGADLPPSLVDTLAGDLLGLPSDLSDRQSGHPVREKAGSGTGRLPDHQNTSSDDRPVVGSDLSDDRERDRENT